MLFRASVLLLSIVFIAASAFAQYGMINHPDNNTMRLPLTGVVRDTRGNAISGARVDLTDLMTGRVLASTYSQLNGIFQFDNLPQGQYEVVVTSGMAEARKRIDGGMIGDVSLQLPSNRGLERDGEGSTVSVTQMKVPGKARKLFQKAMAAFKVARVDDALGYVQQALGVYPDYAKALTLRGVLKMEKGDTAQAQPDLEKAVQLDYSDDMGFVALGNLYNTEGKYDEALRVLERGMSLHPFSWQGLLETARAQNGKKDYEAALQTLAQVDRCVPSQISYQHLYSAQAFIGLKNYEAAATQLRTYLSREPDGPNADKARKTLADLRELGVEAKK